MALPLYNTIATQALKVIAMLLKTPALFTILFFTALASMAQTTVKVDLLKLEQEKKISTYNRHSSVLKAPEPVIHMDEQPDAGIAWITGTAFKNGTIEFDIKGKDVLQQSFVGMALHAVDSLTYDVVYFRPFNFRADDPVRRSHSVQYISLPGYDWPLLREKFPNKYEQPIAPAPDPNNWFHAKIIVKGVTISVYVNHNTKPALVVQQLARLNGTRIGFWVGNGSGGEWKNLTITAIND
ncbi:hypothetical protein [Mucilaginibacter polytrichastri]|uniref:3-keto-disaccharide hydrolase domain-containing protein n=1 Tax=Mucilaginibacter polytrichastri TaxID=1302689 RepID=A0A1Q6A047_9SPHI|nr:hypothetical protein [Mucilaginibacter polytrichastri]OKS87361.1 hypothetical protein RG47T_2822 [Mucilaginibacter polytrichastri]SFT22025.1 hypothetical protein SAMN04487890_11859 [Mucilaginibacter polytrichastri]